MTERWRFLTINQDAGWGILHALSRVMRISDDKRGLRSSFAAWPWVLPLQSRLPLCGAMSIATVAKRYGEGL
jgi:hypothetical protein